MDVYYINIVANNIWVVVKKVLQNKNITIESINTALNSIWWENIIIWIELETLIQAEEIAVDFSQLVDVISADVVDNGSEKAYFLFNINSNCKKTLKKVSHKPDTILDTTKDIVYIYLIAPAEKDIFIAELSNLKLSYTYRMLAFT